jgi:hypothetical protein
MVTQDAIAARFVPLYLGPPTVCFAGGAWLAVPPNDARAHWDAVRDACLALKSGTASRVERHPAAVLTVGTHCWAVYASDGLLYPAEIIALAGERHVEVRFDGYMNVETVDRAAVVVAANQTTADDATAAAPAVKTEAGAILEHENSNDPAR